MKLTTTTTITPRQFVAGCSDAELVELDQLLRQRLQRQRIYTERHQDAIRRHVLAHAPAEAEPPF